MIYLKDRTQCEFSVSGPSFNALHSTQMGFPQILIRLHYLVALIVVLTPYQRRKCNGHVEDHAFKTQLMLHFQSQYQSSLSIM